MPISDVSKVTTPISAGRASADIAAANGSTLVVAEVDSNGMAVKAGSVAVTAKA